MPAWTEEEVLAHGRKYLDDQALMRAARIHTATTPEPTTKRVGRIKGVAPKADRTYEGRVYHSKAEMKAAMELDFMLKCGSIKKWTPQVPYRIIINAVSICSVVVDFEVVHKDFSIEAIEVKGHETELYRLKAKLLKACYPNLKYTIVKA